jgi:hypothetical protein
MPSWPQRHFPSLLSEPARTYEFVNRRGDKFLRTVALTDGGVDDTLGLSPLLPGRSARSPATSTRSTTSSRSTSAEDGRRSGHPCFSPSDWPAASTSPTPGAGRQPSSIERRRFRWPTPRIRARLSGHAGQGVPRSDQRLRHPRQGGLMPCVLLAHGRPKRRWPGPGVSRPLSGDCRTPG